MGPAGLGCGPTSKLQGTLGFGSLKPPSPFQSLPSCLVAPAKGFSNMASLALDLAAASSCSFFFSACCASSFSRRACRARSISSLVMGVEELESMPPPLPEALLPCGLGRCSAAWRCASWMSASPFLMRYDLVDSSRPELPCACPGGSPWRMSLMLRSVCAESMFTICSACPASPTATSKTWRRAAVLRSSDASSAGCASASPLSSRCAVASSTSEETSSSGFSSDIARGKTSSGVGVLAAVLSSVASAAVSGTAFVGALLVASSWEARGSAAARPASTAGLEEALAESMACGVASLGTAAGATASATVGAAAMGAAAGCTAAFGNATPVLGTGVSLGGGADTPIVAALPAAVAAVPAAAPSVADLGPLSRKAEPWGAKASTASWVSVL
mmetsp:Transcript_6698/g.18371  ORF Transcript_6698/g.18371 Transcript_6698/m.18371 type:complete len:389 (+) Transcript_6698:181-1347(+)